MTNAVYVIDHDTKRRASITFLLNNLGIFADPFETIDEFAASEIKPCVVLVHDSGDAVRVLIEAMGLRQLSVAVVVYSEMPTCEHVVEATLAGAVGYINWPGAGSDLLRAIETARERGTRAMTGGSRAAVATMQIEKLSGRERDVLSGMTDGLSNRQIGDVLGISMRTVELHRANMLDKLGVPNSAAAIKLAVEARLPGLTPEPSAPVLSLAS